MEQFHSLFLEKDLIINFGIQKNEQEQVQNYENEKKGKMIDEENSFHTDVNELKELFERGVS